MIWLLWCGIAANILKVKGTSHRLKNRLGGDTDVVLIPQPSSDPDDPLNWSNFRKEYHFWLLIIWGVLVAASVNWSGPVWVCMLADRFSKVEIY